MWGCTELEAPAAIGAFVFPTHVGVYLLIGYLGKEPESFPHARGGVPQTGGSGDFVALVFPTHVGVYQRKTQ